MSDNLEKWVLPYPYEAYTTFERGMTPSFIDYKKRIYGWVANNKSDKTFEQFKDELKYCRNNALCMEVVNELSKYTDKLLYIRDFSGLAFGITFIEHDEMVAFRFPNLWYKGDESKILYPNFNDREFEKLSVGDKVKWLAENCEFIPYRVFEEDVLNDGPCKFSHIKDDARAMKMLEPYLNSLKYPPNDNVYYNIEYSWGKWYLKRNLDLSPKNK